uniref:ADP-ribosylhydrolase ARH3 n=1 Tax=Schistosoma japonicum TaxID=6182 RepID=Q5DAP5_SCHJA|nr:SJCHGC08995 protein [Schistosoma japonicum]
MRTVQTKPLIYRSTKVTSTNTLNLIGYLLMFKQLPLLFPSRMSMNFINEHSTITMDYLPFCRGILIGGLVGDCYGSLYECKPTGKFNVPFDLLKRTIDGFDTKQLMYTDDTQMSLGIIRSLRTQHDFDAEHLAKEFAKNYFENGLFRGYGGTVGRIFSSFKNANYKDPYTYAANLFDGTGSYGNGGAMRIAPAALYALRYSDREFEKLIIDITRLTHTHPLAICGALIQAYAVQKIFTLFHDRLHLDRLNFIDSLLERLEKTEYAVDFKHITWIQALDAYKEKFKLVKALLADDKELSITDVVDQLGNDLKAINSVPTALYVFLRCLKPVPGIEFDSVPLRCIVLSIGLGGDTDTIGCMATALASAYIGIPVDDNTIIPRNVIPRCEGYFEIEEYASWLSNRLQQDIVSP